MTNFFLKRITLVIFQLLYKAKLVKIKYHHNQTVIKLNLMINLFFFLVIDTGADS
ncbi:hypothetical protein A1OE_268 [Candidatus Endolissoclinum faulkneri L2]|uniref:Uncharacterized protein n=1 Tax=Candidatus Endolissoclinum faulkneri L2 TaxID=1193729 RepID=K7Z3D5_9PROT|nr:hypothetical protein A1OE_268 [Candidatus Endolissoclinum faulkneri L2]